MNILSIAEEIRSLDTVLRELKGLNRLLVEQERQKGRRGAATTDEDDDEDNRDSAVEADPSLPNPSTSPISREFGDLEEYADSLGKSSSTNWNLSPHHEKKSGGRGSGGVMMKEERSWYPPSIEISDIRSRKRRRMLQNLRAIDEMKAQLYLRGISQRRKIENGHGALSSSSSSTAQTNGITVLRDPKSISNLIQSEEALGESRLALPPSMRAAVCSGEACRVGQYIAMGSDILHKPYIKRDVRKAIMSNRLSLSDTWASSRVLKEGDVIHVPFMLAEKLKFLRFVAAVSKPLEHLEVIARQLPGRSIKDCRRYFLDEFKQSRGQKVVALQGQEQNDDGFLWRVTRDKQKLSVSQLRRGVTRNATTPSSKSRGIVGTSHYHYDDSRGGTSIQNCSSSSSSSSRRRRRHRRGKNASSPTQDSSLERSVFSSSCSSGMLSSLSSSVIGLLLAREHGGRGGFWATTPNDDSFAPQHLLPAAADDSMMGWRRRQQQQLAVSSSASTRQWIRSSRQNITRKMFSRFSRDTVYEENTGGSITDVKFGTHAHTKDKIIYGVTDTKEFHCAVYDTGTKERKVLQGHTDAVEEVHITARNYITGSHDTNINVYDLNSDLQWQFKEHTDKVLSMSMHFSKPLFASAAYQSDKLWLCNYHYRVSTSLSLPLAKPTVAAGAMRFGNERYSETLVVGTQDEAKKGNIAICCIDRAEARLIDSVPTDLPVQCVTCPPACSPLSGKFVFTCSEEKLYFYDTLYQSSSKKITTVAVSSQNIIRLPNKSVVGHNIHDTSFSPNGILLQSCGEDNTVVVHDVRRFDRPLFVLEHEYMSGVHGVACQWSSDSRFLVSGADDCTIRLWDVGRGNGGKARHSASTSYTNLEERLGFMDTEVNLIKHNQSGAICALSLSTLSDMVVAGTNTGRIVVHGMQSFE